MSEPAPPPDTAPPRFAFRIDRSLAVPVGVQLRGQIEYGVACGEIPRGAQMPSVRELSQDLGLAHVTVAGVYKELGQKGLLTTHPGRGTFVADGVDGAPKRDLAALHRAVERLLAEAERLGFTPEEVSQALGTGLGRLRSPERPLRLAFVGIFPEATRFYVDELRKQLPPGDRIEALTVQDLLDDAVAARVSEMDLVITLGHREAQVRDLLSGPPVVSVQFIPADFTRTALAALSPLMRLGLVVTFEDFLPTMRAGVARFAPHIDHVQAVTLDSPGLPELLRGSDVIVYATGSERVVAELPSGTQAFEYRHVPDPRAVEGTLLPLIEERRMRLASQDRAPEERTPHAN
ncbi:GntR family transcriptional regulator [Deinococcus apachensis]|uniref:GntR family transcriptional regulator n=1 Tax=Deinococcus apachensis TaxID=309886 RepID=UPI00038095B2|nr:GntR family transcriptional regulator [Deinococcus apachensis]